VDILSNFRLPLHHLSKRNAWIIEPLNIQKWALRDSFWKGSTLFIFDFIMASEILPNVFLTIREAIIRFYPGSELWYLETRWLTFMNGLVWTSNLGRLMNKEMKGLTETTRFW
jgi:hypothetical protein